MKNKKNLQKNRKPLLQTQQKILPSKYEEFIITWFIYTRLCRSTLVDGFLVLIEKVMGVMIPQKAESPAPAIIHEVYSFISWNKI